MTEQAVQFQEGIKTLLRDILKDPHYQKLLYNPVRGEIARSRTMMILRYCYLPEEDGVHVLDNLSTRQIIETEAHIPISVFYERMDISSWNARNPNKFYSVGINWKAVLQHDFKSLMPRTESDVNCLINFAGGGHPSLDETMEIDSVHIKVNRLIEHAIIENRKSQIQRVHYERATRSSAIAYTGYVYNLIALALNPVNQQSAAHWQLIEESLVSWDHFIKLGRRSAQTIYTNLIRLYNGEYVYLWDNEAILARGEGAAINIWAEDDIPQFALPESHFEARNALSLPHLIEVNNANLTGFIITNALTDGVIVYRPEFLTSQRNYSAIVGQETNEIFIAPTTEYQFATTEIEGNLVLSLGMNNFVIKVISQDGERIKLYNLIVDKQG